MQNHHSKPLAEREALPTFRMTGAFAFVAAPSQRFPRTVGLLFAFVLALIGFVLDALGEAQRRSPAQEANRQGLDQQRLGRYDGALRHFERALELDPSMHDARFNASCAQARLGRLVFAATNLARFLEAEPDQGLRVPYDPDGSVLPENRAFLSSLRRRIRWVMSAAPNGTDAHRVAPGGFPVWVS